MTAARAVRPHGKRPTVRMTRRELVQGLASGAVVAFGGAAVGGCEQNPALGREQLVLVSDGALAQLSAGVWNEARATTPETRDRAARARVRRAGGRIVEAAHRFFPRRGLDTYDWEFVAFEDEQVNAWVLPGGKVGFYTGILDIMDNDDQVATVMGHEVGHVVGRHAAERYSQQVLAQGMMVAANVALASSDRRHARKIAAVLGAGVTFGIVLPYSRRHEYEADRLGVDFMLGARYAAPEALRFWEAMAERSARAPLEFMSTHPSDANRIAAMHRHIAVRTAA